MPQFSQILLYTDQAVEGQGHQIDLVNPRFSNTGTTIGDWVCRSSEWQWTGGTGYAQFTDDGSHHQHLRQDFPNPMRDNLYYDITFTVSARTQGSLRVALIGDGFSIPVGSVSTNATHTLTVYSSSGSTHPTGIMFQPGYDIGWFDGRIDEVSIVQNRTLSPVESSVQWEPYGLLDMYADERLGITYQVSDLTSISRRFGGWSKTFKIPGTSNNKKILSHLTTNEAQPTVFDEANKSKATLLVDDEPIVNGWFVLKNVVTQGELSWFEVELFDATINLVDAIKGKKLSDLDLSRYGHYLNKDNVVDSWSSGWTWHNGYFYPLLLNLEDRFRLGQDFRPAWANRAIWDQIFREADLSYDLSPELEVKFNQLLTAPTGKKPEASEGALDAHTVLAAPIASQQWTTDNIFAENPIVGTYTDDELALFDNEIQDPSDNWSVFTDVTYFTAPFDGNFNLALTANTTVTTSLPAPSWLVTPDPSSGDENYGFWRWDIVDVSTNVVIASSEQKDASASVWNGDTSTAHQFSLSGTVELYQGQQVAVRGYIENALGFFQLYFIGTYFVPIHFRPSMSMTLNTSGSYFEVTASDSIPVSENMLIEPSAWIGKISQEQFISDMTKLFNLYFVPDLQNERLIHVYSRNELYGTTNILDRSGKVALDEQIERKRLSEESGKALTLGYKEPNDDFNKHWSELVEPPGRTYGDYDFDFETTLSQEQRESRLQIYTPSPITTDADGRYVPAVLSRGEQQDVKLLVRCHETYPTYLRLLYWDDTTQLPQEDHFDHYRPALHIDAVTGSTYDINFGHVELMLTDQPPEDLTSNTLYEEHYEEQLNQWKEARVFTCMMNLTNREVLEHVNDIGARIFVEELGGWFQLVEITDWDPTMSDQALTKVKLIQSLPSDRQIHKEYTVAQRPNGILGANPVYTGGVRPSTADAFGTKTTVFNTNIGFNTIKSESFYNSVNGSGNTIYNNAYNNFIQGDNNNIGAGVSGSTVFGNNVTVNESNSFYISNYATFRTGGASFYNSAFTINQQVASFFGQSGVTISSGLTEFYGPSGVTITNSGITINGVFFGSGSTPTYVQPGLNITTGGTISRPVISTVGSPSFTAVTVGSGVTITSTGITIQGLLITSGFTGGGGTLSGNYLPISGGTLTGDTSINSGQTIRFIATTGRSTGISAPSTLTGDWSVDVPDASGELALVPKSKVYTGDITVDTSHQYYMCNTFSGGFYAHLPASPSLGEQYHFFDQRGSFSSGPLTISGGTNRVGPETYLVLSADHRSCFVTWNGIGWSPIITSPVP